MGKYGICYCMGKQTFHVQLAPVSSKLTAIMIQEHGNQWSIPIIQKGGNLLLSQTFSLFSSKLGIMTIIIKTILMVHLYYVLFASIHLFFFLPCQAVFTAHFILKRFSTSHLSVCHIAFVQNWVLAVETSLFPFRKSWGFQAIA